MEQTSPTKGKLGHRGIVNAIDLASAPAPASASAFAAAITLLRIPNPNSPIPVLQGFCAAAGSLTIFSRSFCRSVNSGSIFCWMAPIRFWVSAGVLSSRLWPAELS